MIKKISLLFLTVLLASGLAGSVFAETGTGGAAEIAVKKIHLDVYSPVCGDDPEEEPPSVYIDEENYYVRQESPAFWTVDDSWDDPESAVHLQEPIVGDREYVAVITIETLPGYYFDQDTCFLVYDDENGDEADEYYVPFDPVKRNSRQIVAAVKCTADHDWDWNQKSGTDPTCISTGVEKEVCKTDPSHTRTTVLDIDPDAHDWGGWIVKREATKTEEGEKVHICSLCGTEETEAIPRIVYPYTSVYEPDTSWPMAATVAWEADAQALKTASEEIRPATAFVWLDAELKVYDRDGGLLSDDLQSYVDATVSGMIPAFYIEDAQTATALKEWISSNGLQDCFVVSTPEHKDLVKDVADLLHVRGLLDYTAVKNPDRTALLDMISSVNGAHGKVVLLSEEAATRENIRMMQSLATTVWVKTKADTRSLVTLYTNGVNGVVTDDYQAALKAEELFQDDAPSLLRLPLIIGHRGDPSTYVENTLDSARGAYGEGVDSVENDIQLSKDGELFILHDDEPRRLLGLSEIDEFGKPYPAEHYTLEQLRAHPFLWDDPQYGIIIANEIPAVFSRYGSLYGQEEQKQYTVPALREYIEAFKGTGLVHDTEIKSYNPAILKVYKELVDSCDAWDQFFTITFNKDILDAAYRDYPEISMGALGMSWLTDVHYEDYDAISAEQGPEAALALLYGTIDQWNATYNPDLEYGKEVVKAGRHRGLTVWPWTYRSDLQLLAGHVVSDYLNAVSGMTMDDPWTLSDEIVEINSEDVTVSDESEIPKPQAVTRAGEKKILEDAEPVCLEKLNPSGTSQLMIWKYKAELNVRGTDPADYYLYSNPFVMNRSSGSGSIVCPRDGSCPITPFTDTDKNEWYHDGVHWALQKEVMNGTSGSTFEPMTSTTRAMIVTMLWRMEGSPAVNDQMTFKDVPDGKWYTEAIRWAAANAIVNGYGKDTFGTTDHVTREQIATILYRYAQFKGMDVSKGDHTSLNDYTDRKDISEWADQAFHWSVGAGIIQGMSENTLSPKTEAVRAQVAVMLMRISIQDDDQTVPPFLKMADYQEWAKNEGYPSGLLDAQGVDGINQDYFHSPLTSMDSSSGKIVIGDSRCCQMGIYESRINRNDFAAYAVWGGHYEKDRNPPLMTEELKSEVKNCFEEQIRSCGKSVIYFFSTVNDYDYINNENNDGYINDAINAAEYFASMSYEYDGSIYHPEVIVVGFDGGPAEGKVLSIPAEDFNRFIDDYNQKLRSAVSESDLLRDNLSSFTTVPEIVGGKASFITDGLHYSDDTLQTIVQYLVSH